MFSLRTFHLNRSYLALFGIALLCAALFWATVFCIATLMVFTSGNTMTAQTSLHNCSQFVERAHPGADDAVQNNDNPATNSVQSSILKDYT